MSIKNRETLSADTGSPDQEIISKAAELIKQGGLVVFPTSTFYGLGAQASNSAAVDRIFRVKARDANKPILVLIACDDLIDALTKQIPKRLANVTLVSALTDTP